MKKEKAWMEFQEYIKELFTKKDFSFIFNRTRVIIPLVRVMERDIDTYYNQLSSNTDFDPEDKDEIFDFMDRIVVMRVFMLDLIIVYLGSLYSIKWSRFFYIRQIVLIVYELKNSINSKIFNKKFYEVLNYLEIDESIGQDLKINLSNLKILINDSKIENKELRNAGAAHRNNDILQSWHYIHSFEELDIDKFFEKFIDWLFGFLEWEKKFTAELDKIAKKYKFK